VLIIAAVMAIGLIVPVVNRRRRRPTSPPADAVGGARGWRLDGVLAFDLALVILFAAALWLSRRFDARAGLFPWTITAAALVLAIVATALSRVGGRVSPMPDMPDGAPEGSRGETRRTAAICGWILGMYAAILASRLLARHARCDRRVSEIRARARPISIGLSLAGFAFAYGLFEKGDVRSRRAGCSCGWATAADGPLLSDLGDRGSW
jgi:hypothetical protein